MIKKLSLFILLNLLFLNTVKALEITNIEWTVLGDIQVTVYDPENYTARVTCTAFYIPENNKPIGGGSASFTARIAQVRIDLPNSYTKKNLNTFKIDCK